MAVNRDLRPGQIARQADEILHRLRRRAAGRVEDIVPVEAGVATGRQAIDQKRHLVAGRIAEAEGGGHADIPGVADEVAHMIGVAGLGQPRRRRDPALRQETAEGNAIDAALP